jgi:regulatory protein
LEALNMEKDSLPPSAFVKRSRCLDSAFRILSRRDHTRNELQVKLRHKGFDAAAIESALARCNELGYIDDSKTAMSLAGQLVDKGYGPLRVRHTLMQKGLDGALIEEALGHCGDETAQEQNARRMLVKKALRLNREADPLRRRQIAYRFLAGRGFPPAVISRALADD